MIRALFVVWHVLSLGGPEPRLLSAAEHGQQAEDAGVEPDDGDQQCEAGVTIRALTPMLSGPPSHDTSGLLRKTPRRMFASANSSTPPVATTIMRTTMGVARMIRVAYRASITAAIAKVRPAAWAMSEVSSWAPTSSFFACTKSMMLLHS